MRLFQQVLKSCHAHRARTLLAGAAVTLLLAFAFADALLAGPMRAWAGQIINSKLSGYTVRIGRVRPHLWRLAFDLDDVILVQNTHPLPPVADVGALRFSLLLRELFRFKVAGDLTIQRPALHINLDQLEAQARGHVSLKEQGWQSAVEAIYPIKLDRVGIEDGSLLYLSTATEKKPIQLTRIYMVARNVRNIAAGRASFPSPVSLEGVLFDTGKIGFKGAANFLREPTAAIQGELSLEHVPLDRTPQVPVTNTTFDAGDSQLAINSHPKGVSLKGRFCMRDQALFLPVIQQISALPPGAFHIDLSELSYMDSIGLSLIFAANDEARRHNITLVLDHPTALVSKLLHVTAVDKMMQVNV